MKSLAMALCLCAVTTSAFAQFPNFINIATGPEVDGGGSGSGVAVGDFDGNGELDIYVVNSGAHPPGPSLVPNVLLFNNGGVFTSVTTVPVGDTGASQGTAAADYDNDGDLDLVLANDGTANLVLQNDGMGNFTNVAMGAVASAGAGTSFSWADYDNDGFVDLFLTNDGEANVLLRNDGGTGFIDTTTPQLADLGPSAGGVWGDYDNDGDQDLYVTNAGGLNVLYQNNAGTLVALPPGVVSDPGPSYGASWIDYNNDGNLDLYVPNFMTPNRLFEGDGLGNFVDVAPMTGADDMGPAFQALWADYDNDGDLDLFIVNHFTPNVLLRNDGAGTWTDITPPSLADFTAVHTGGAWADFDGDGDVDVYIANAAGDNRLLRNDEAVAAGGGNGNQWLHLTLEGTLSNRSAIGAKVVATTGSLTQTRWVTSGASHLASESLTVEFGLGTATLVDAIEITWPSGIVQTLTNVPAGQKIDVVEVGQPQFVRGDCNDDGANNIADGITLLGFLFPQGTPSTLACDKACDANDDGALNVADAITLLNSLFGTNPAPLAGPNNCGIDPTSDSLTCDVFSNCP